MDKNMKDRLEAAGYTVGNAEDFVKDVLTPKYDLPRPGDPDWEDANPGPNSYKCGVCGNKTIHNDRYDAYYCAICNRWQEPACSDDTCEFCSNRPRRPL